VKDAQGNPVTGRTSWKRFAAVMVPTTAAAGALVLMTAQGALATSIKVSGQAFKLRATTLDGRGFSQYGGFATDTKGTSHPVAISAIKNGTIDHLCQSVKTPIGKNTAVVLTITAGEGKDKVKASNLVVDADQLDGNATFTNIEIGNDASTLKKGGAAHGQEGLFGQQADRVVIRDLKQQAWATTAGTFTLPGLSLRLKVNGPECY
jgi:Family of unknown function (DUF6230)